MTQAELGLLGEGFADYAERLFEVGSAAAKIKSGMSLFAEVAPVREKQPCFLLEVWSRIGDAGGLEVHPGKIGGLDVRNFDGTHLLAAKTGDQVAVVP